MSVAERLTLRQTQSMPVLADLRQKLLSWKEQLLPKHPMAEAVNYTLSVFCWCWEFHSGNACVRENAGELH